MEGRIVKILPMNGSPDQRLNALLEILSGYEASLHD
jgi:hypothetical protein